MTETSVHVSGNFLFFRTDTLVSGSLGNIYEILSSTFNAPVNPISQDFSYHVRWPGVDCSRNHRSLGKPILHLPNFRPSVCAIRPPPWFAAAPDPPDSRSLLTTSPNLLHYFPASFWILPTLLQTSRLHLKFPPHVSVKDRFWGQNYTIFEVKMSFSLEPNLGLASKPIYKIPDLHTHSLI